jgi:hypothetical protein
VHKGNTTLVEAVNAVVARLRDDGKLAEILQANGLPASAGAVG